MSKKDTDLILLELLRMLDVDVPEDVATVRDLPAPSLYQACVRGLKTINPNVVFNSTMPRGNAAKVNVCQQVLSALETAGFRNASISYSALLYPNEGDSRTILMWLNQNVKINQVDDNKAPASAKDVLHTAIALELKKQMSQPWAPHFLMPESAHHKHDKCIETVPIRSAFTEGSASSKNAKHAEYVAKHMPFAIDQPKKRSQVAMSILDSHSKAIVLQREEFLLRNDRNLAQKRSRVKNLITSKLRLAMLEEPNESLLIKESSTDRALRRGLASRFIRQRNQIDKVDAAVTAPAAGGGKSSEEQAKEAREAELLALENELKHLEHEIQAAKLMLSDLIAGKRQLDSEAAAVAAHAAELDKQKAEIEMVRRLMQDPEGNKAKLEQITQLNSQKLIEAAEKWEPKRQALIEGYRKERDKFENRKRAAANLLEDIEGMRAKAKEIAADIQSKDQRYRNLLEQWKTLEKGKLRSMHTDKILDALNNVKKQDKDIDKVLLESRDLKREIAQMTDTLSRSFAVVDEMVYADAKTDASAKTAYKLIVAMNEQFNEVIDSLSGTVATRNEALDLERKIDSLKMRTDTLDLERVEKDLDALKKENVNLAVQAASVTTE